MSLAPFDPSALFDIAGKSAVVIGATGAFGKIACQALGKSGARLTIAAGTAEKLDALEKDLSAEGIEVRAIARRSNTEEDSQTIIDAAVTAFGAVDIFVVASGINDIVQALDMSPKQFQDLMTFNVEGVWLAARAAAKQMIAQGGGGKIVITSSVRGKQGHGGGYAGYSASKGAIDAMIRALAYEWGQHGITVNAVAPTVFRSPRTAWMFEDTDKAKAFRAGYVKRIPMGRLAEPEDLAGPLLFLCSKASNFHTGHVTYVDGGYTIG